MKLLKAFYFSKQGLSVTEIIAGYKQALKKAHEHLAGKNEICTVVLMLVFVPITTSL